MNKLIRQTNKLFISTLITISISQTALAQFGAPEGLVVPTLSKAPITYETAEGEDIRVRVIARGLDHPWSIAFLPNGDFLVTEKDSGLLRLIQNDILVEEPISGVPEVVSSGFTGLLGVILHPDFENTPYVYLSYNKPLANDQSAVAVARGLWDGESLQNTTDIFVAENGTTSGSHIIFGPDEMLYVTLFGSFGNMAQEGNTHQGKVLRLTAEGKVPSDNPFVNNPAYKPEIYSIGHRGVMGMTIHPETKELWSIEMGPNGGDEVNILKAGANYGWPIVSLGRDYSGPWQSDNFQQEGIQDPIIYWMPAISVSGLTFYTGDKFPKWKGNLFVGGLRYGEIPGTGQLQRIHFNDQMEEIRRESLLVDLRQRVRDVRQGPDGFLYVLTDEVDGAVLRIEPLQ